MVQPSLLRASVIVTIRFTNVLFAFQMLPPGMGRFASGSASWSVKPQSSLAYIFRSSAHLSEVVTKNLLRWQDLQPHPLE